MRFADLLGSGQETEGGLDVTSSSSLMHTLILDSKSRSLDTVNQFDLDMSQ